VKVIIFAGLFVFCQLGFSADIISNEELKNTQLPVIHEEVDDATALMNAMKRKDIIEDKAGHLPFVLLPHRPNYVMPFSYTDNPYEDPYAEVLQDKWTGFKKVESIFQISVKYQIAQLDEANKYRIFVAYTNKSYWQVYNEDLSRPFRETNHEPELILQISPDWKFINRVTLALNHQSNGQYQGFSRSWNRVIAGLYHVEGDSVYGIQPWWRMPEDQSDDPDDPKDDDNPDIYNYLGYANFIWYKRFGTQSAMLTFGNNFDIDSNKGWGNLEWNFPLTARLRGFVQWHEGYGHSLIEYNHYQRRIGIGIKITDYL